MTTELFEGDFELQAKKFIKKHKIGLIVFFILAASSLVALTWFRGNYAIGIGDNFPASDRSKFLEKINSGWRSESNTGGPEQGIHHLFPSSLLYYPLSALGFGNVTISKLWLYLSLFLPSLFMYLFLDRFLGKRIHYLIKASVSIYYVFNSIAILTPVGLSLTKFPVLLGMPVLAYIIVLIFDQKSWEKKYLFGVVLALTTVAFSGAFGNIADVTPMAVIIPALVIYEIATHDEKIKHILLLLGTIILAFMLNFWWIYSSFLSVYMFKAEFLKAVENFAPGDSFMFDAMRLFGFWGLHGYLGVVPNYDFGSFYYKPIGVMITYIIPFLVFSSIIFLNISRKIYKDRSKILLFLFLSFFGIFLVKGTRDPLGGIFYHLFVNYGFFRIFREPFSKFSYITLFSFVVVLTYSLFFISQWMKKIKLSFMRKWSEFIISVLFLVLVFVIAFPMFNKETVSVYTYSSRKQQIVKVPQYWLDLYDYTKESNLDGRVLTVPKNTYYRKSYVWERGFVGHPYDLYLDGDAISGRVNPLVRGDEMANHLYSAIEEYNWEFGEKDEKKLGTIVNLVRLLGIEYALRMNDFDWVSYGQSYIPWSYESLDVMFENMSEYFEEQESFGVFTATYLAKIPFISGGPRIYRFDGEPTGKYYFDLMLNREGLIFYNLKDKYKLPRIYLANNVESYTDDNDFYEKIKSTKYFDYKPLFLGEDDYSKTSTVVADQELTYERIRDGIYKVSFSEPLQGGALMVFSESYGEGWELAWKCGFLGCRDFIDVPHFRGNLYANAWLLDGDSIDGASFFIAHESEQRIKTGIFVSFIALAFSVTAVVVLLYRDKKDKRES